jgi:hypothetical protein
MANKHNALMVVKYTVVIEASPKLVCKFDDGASIAEPWSVVFVEENVHMWHELRVLGE